MNSAKATLLACFGLLWTPSCVVVKPAFLPDTGVYVGYRDVTADCAAQDVVFFGELHDNDRCHEQQLSLLKSIFARRPDVIVSMEMFERDVQPEVDKFLAGELPEEEFRQKARAWKNWHHYRGIVQFAKKQGLQVVAANAPLELVRKVSRGGGLAAVRGNPHVAREVLAPKDAYFESFVNAMSGHGVLSDEKMRGYYEAQCLRDDTMAESIATALRAARAAGRSPLVFHLCGRMHSDNRLGTVQRLQRRMKGLAVRVISTSPVTWVRERSGDIRLVAPHMMKPPAAPMQAPAKTSKAPAKTSKADPNARPGLGFKPLYDIGEQYGVGVDYPIPGGAADKAGIKSGDIIISLGGEELQDIEHYTEVLAEQTVGKKVKVVVLRDKKKMPLEVVIGVSGR